MIRPQRLARSWPAARTSTWLLGCTLASMLCICSAESALAEGARGKAAAAKESTRSLRAWSGLNALSKRLDAAETRRSALLRLSSRGTDSALRVIAKWLEEHESRSLGAGDWVDISRALAPHAARPEARAWLMRILGGAPLAQGDTSDWAELSRGIAALALAKAADPESTRALASALGQGENTARWARAALLAHPPKDLEPLLQSASAARSELITTLDELGDQRSFEALREMARTGTAEVQAHAVLALYRQGHLETVEVARSWAKTATRHAGLLKVATEILLGTRDPAAGGAFESLLALDAATALELAERFPSPELSEALVSFYATGSNEQRFVVINALSSCGGKAALQHLGKTLADAELGVVVARALSRMNDTESARLLLDSLRRPATEAHALRALIARGWRTGRSWPQVTEVVARWAKSDIPEHRALGQWGKAVASERHALELVQSDDWNLVLAGASTVWLHGDALAARALSRLGLAKGSRLKAALAMGLADGDSARALSAGRLHALLDEVPELALVVAPWLTARREERFPARIESLLGSPDPRVAAAALLGLGDSPDPKAGARLAAAYFAAVDVHTRRAAIAGSARNAERFAPNEALAFAADFDPDPTTRSLAKMGALPTFARGEALWVASMAKSPGSLVLLENELAPSQHALLPAGGVLVLLGWPSETPTISIQDW